MPLRKYIVGLRLVEPRLAWKRIWIFALCNGYKLITLLTNCRLVLVLVVLESEKRCLEVKRLQTDRELQNPHSSFHINPWLLFCRWRTTSSLSTAYVKPSATTSVKAPSRSAARPAARLAAGTRTVHVSAEGTAWSTPTAALLRLVWPGWTWRWSEPQGCGETIFPRRMGTLRFFIIIKEPQHRWSGTMTSPPGTTSFALKLSTYGTESECI